MAKSIPLPISILLCATLLFALNAMNGTPAKAESHYNQSLTPQLFDAIESGDVSVVARLLRSGADPNARNTDGCPALFRASDTGKTEEGYHPLRCVRLLVEYGADVNSMDKVTGETPLMVSAGSNSLESLRYLLRHGAKINAKDKTGKTALMFACQSSSDSDAYLNIVAAKYLIYRGADVNATDANGDTAMMQMAWNGGYPTSAKYEESVLSITRFMLKNGAKISLKDKQGKSARQLADKDGFVEFADFLTEETH